MRKLKWTRHSDLAIRKTPTVGRREYLDHMTFEQVAAPMFTEIFGPLIGLKEEWEEQGATAQELDFSAFRYRFESRGHLPVVTGRLGGLPEELLEESDEFRLRRARQACSAAVKRGDCDRTRTQAAASDRQRRLCAGARPPHPQRHTA